MEQYSYHEETGKITLEKKAVQNSENAGKSIYLMSLDEFLSHPRKLVRKNNFIHSMTPIQYCKIEKYRECVQGTMRVPKGNKGQVCIHNFGFYLSEQELYLVEESHFLMEYLNKMAEGTYEGYSFRQILLALFEELLQDEVLYLQKQEEHLASLEEELLKKIPDYFYEMIMKYRKRFNIFHAYYEQLMNVGDMMCSNLDNYLPESQRRFWEHFTARAERLHDHTETLREYLMQIRSLYQAQIDAQQNRVITMLTIITTIFLPLTLIAGWYGMNFPQMPEFGWKYAYLGVIVISALIVIVEILYFKKKKML